MTHLDSFIQQGNQAVLKQRPVIRLSKLFWSPLALPWQNWRNRPTEWRHFVPGTRRFRHFPGFPRVVAAGKPWYAARHPSSECFVPVSRNLKSCKPTEKMCSRWIGRWKWYWIQHCPTRPPLPWSCPATWCTWNLLQVHTRRLAATDCPLTRIFHLLCSRNLFRQFKMSWSNELSFGRKWPSLWAADHVTPDVIVTHLNSSQMFSLSVSIWNPNGIIELKMTRE